MPSSTPSSSPDRQTIILLVRLRSGAAGETDRMVHVVPLPAGGPVPRVLTAYCGVEIRAGVVEMLPNICGMPCTACLIGWAVPGAMGIPASG